MEGGMTNAELISEVNAARVALHAVCDEFEAANERGVTFAELEPIERRLIEAEEDLHQLMSEVRWRTYSDPKGGPDRWF
jgi:hypothetical protein